MIDYKWNIYRISGEKAPELSKRAYKLLSANVGMFTAQQVGEVLYLYHVKEMPAKEIKKRFSFIPHQTFRAILRNTFNPEASYMFFEMLEHEPEMLELLFTCQTN
ncbi:hypothetical protein KM918_25080 [Priestia megaterium]|uniref:hypothetical protein n=1 Tax=Priestia megaterium TaxID=1404 RepID=UPI001C223B12|nr:hypothetical protein [Priestia megaterium]MBU8690574.1 hypothetical protein [Priestia megaterium]